MSRGLTITVPNINDVLQSYDQVAIFKAEHRLDPYVEITALPGYGELDRIVLMADETQYVFVDPEGTPTDWYRTAFISTFTGIQGELTPPIQGLPVDPNTGIITARFNTSDGATFADGYGFDGTFDLPATGGSRTNRNPDGYGTKGYWDGVGGQPNPGIELLCVRPLTPRGECVVGETLVETPFGAKQIKHIEVGEQVKVWDTNSNQFVFTTVTKRLLNETKDGTLLRVITKHARSLVVTAAHPFWTKKGKIEAKDLQVGDCVGVDPLATKVCNDLPNNLEVISEQQFREQAKQYYSDFHPDLKIDKYLDKHVENLKAKQLLPLNTPEKILFVTRILAYTFGDASCWKHSNGIDSTIRFGGTCEELEEARKELINNGFKPTELVTKAKNSEYENRVEIAKQINGETTSFDLNTGSLGVLLRVLGAPQGCKTIQKLSIPDWVMQYKRLRCEFLSVLYDNEGQIAWKLKSKGATRRLGRVTAEVRISFNSDINLHQSNIYYAQQLQQCFADADIDMRIAQTDTTGAMRKDGIQTRTYYLINQIPDSLAWIRFSEYFTAPYNKNKREALRLISEYRRESEWILQKARESKEKAIKLYSSGVSYGEIAKQLKVSRGVIENWNTKHKTSEVRLPHSFSTFEEWCNLLENEKQELFYDEIVSIERIESNADVYDVSLEISPWFVTNGIVTFDCYKNKAVAMTRVMLKDIDPNCVTGDTLVTTTLGIKRIQEVNPDDKLYVYDWNTKQYSYQPVEKLLINTTKNGRLLELVTASGRRLRCTEQQPMIEYKGEVLADQLKVGDKIAVNPLGAVEQISFNPEEVFFTIEDFEKTFPETHSKTREQVAQWLPLKGETACVFARLLGFLFGDGHLAKDLSQLIFASDSLPELEAVRNECVQLGATPTQIWIQQIPSSLTCIGGEVKSIQGNTQRFEIVSTALARVVHLLGCPKGDKAIQQCGIPNWILNNKWLLKQFISSYYGADGCDVINSQGIREINFSFNKDKALDVADFINQWKQAFATFGIPLRVREDENSGAIRKDGIVTTKYELISECSEAEGIIKFASQIGICYHKEKQQNLALASEYLRFIEAKKKVNEQERQKVFSCVREGLTVMQAVEELNPLLKGREPDFERLECTVDEYLEKENIGSNKAGAVYSGYPFEKWVKEHTIENRFYEELVEINKIESDEDVYDCKFAARYIFAESQFWVDCWAFQEDEVDMFLEASLADFNAEPTFTNFNWHDLEDRWLHVIALGAQVMALYAQGLIEAGREFVITDNGISFQPPAISGHMQSTASQLLSHYDQLKQRIKGNMKPRPQGVGLFQPLAIHPAFLRLRHLRERRLF